MVKAYRVGSSKSAYKTQVEAGKLKAYDGGRTGIDISFDSEGHADYYFQTKKGDPGALLFVWEFPDVLFEMIKAQIDHVGGNKIPQAWKNNPDSPLGKMWKALATMRAPTDTTDPEARQLGVYAPHFNKNWIPVLNQYATGGDATVYTYEQYFPDEVPFIGADDPVWFYEPGNRMLMLLRKSQTTRSGRLSPKKWLSQRAMRLKMLSRISKRGISVESITRLKESQANGVSLLPRCSIVGTHQCPDRVFTHCLQCGRAVCLSHIEAVKDQECLLDHSICVVCLHPERYPRDPSVGRWRPSWRYRPGIS